VPLVSPKEIVEKALGSPGNVREQVDSTPRVGVVNGLAYTPVGGEVLPIEAVQYDGGGKLRLTGPSAGVAMFVALASLNSSRKVHGDIGMTGEVNLRGDVLPIGGLAEKTLAALAAGIKTVLIPRGNEKDIPELPTEVRESLTIVPVDTVDDVIDLALVA